MKSVPVGMEICVWSGWALVFQCSTKFKPSDWRDGSQLISLCTGVHRMTWNQGVKYYSVPNSHALLFYALMTMRHLHSCYVKYQIPKHCGLFLGSKRWKDISLSTLKIINTYLHVKSFRTVVFQKPEGMIICSL